jgi:rRNA maturation protein Nop10
MWALIFIDIIMSNDSKKEDKVMRYVCMDDAMMGMGMLIFPQMYKQMTDQNKKDGDKEQKIMAICPHCGAVNEHPYKFCKECGKRPEVQRDISNNAGMFRICPYCGKELDLPKPPRFCPYCAERFG